MFIFPLLYLRVVPVTKIKRQEIPIATRDRKSALRETKEWKETLKLLAAGLKPFEAIEVGLDSKTATKLKIKHPTRVFADMLKLHIKKQGLRYDVFQRSTERGRNLYVVGR